MIKYPNCRCIAIPIEDYRSKRLIIKCPYPEKEGIWIYNREAYKVEWNYQCGLFTKTCIKYGIVCAIHSDDIIFSGKQIEKAPRIEKQDNKKETNHWDPYGGFYE